MPKFLLEALAIFLAMFVGMGVFLAIFWAPTWFFGNEILLAWGWIGWIPGLLAGKWIGGFVSNSVRNTFLTDISSESELKIRAWLFLLGIGSIVFSVFQLFWISISDLLFSILPFVIGLFFLITAWTVSDNFAKKLSHLLKII